MKALKYQELIHCGRFDVPTTGMVIDYEFFIWLITDHSESVAMGRCVVASTSRGSMHKEQFEQMLY